MQHYRYLIVGGGMTADAAVKAIRKSDPKGSLGLISAEADPPYKRPPLSKGLWRGKELRSVWLKTENLGAVLHLDRRATALDLARKQVADDRGDVYAFEKLLLATGGRPRRLPFDRDGQVIYYRTLDDYRRVLALTQEKQRFAVVGGGFIGSEMAAALAMHGKEVVMLFPEAGIGARLFPSDLALFLNDYYRKRGVEVLPGLMITGLEKRLDTHVLQTGDGREIVADAVIAGIGLEPNAELAESAGLETGNGIVVDEFLRTSHPDILAAGDVAAFYDPLLGTRRRVEHEDNAFTMGRMAGMAMAGDLRPYDHSPFFYSDLFDLGYEAVGDLNSELDTAADWVEPLRKGVIYYLQDGRVRGVLLWDVWGRVAAARKLIAEPGPFRPWNLQET